MVEVMTRKYFQLPLLALAIAMTSSLSSQAQRLVPKQRGIEIAASVPIIKGQSLFQQENFGLSLSLTRNLKRGRYTYLSAVYEGQALSYRTYKVPLRDYLLQAGYAHPFLSDKGKNVFLYLGASAIAGYEDINQGEQLLPDGATLLDHSKLVYGLGTQTSIEYFLTDRLILSAKAQMLYLFNSDAERLRPSISLGLRYQL